MPNYVLSSGEFVPFTYTVQEIDRIFNVIPVSSYGDKTSDPIPVTIDGYTVRIGQVPLVMAGKRYNLGVTDVVTTSNPNSLRWLFITLVDGVPSYSLRDTYVVDEAADVMYIGTVSTSVNRVVTAAINKVVRLDNYRLSATRVGSAIPMSTGDPTGTGNFAW